MRLKVIVYTTFQILTITSFAQKIVNGKYGGGLGYPQFIFYNRDSFFYSVTTCTEGISGKGIYKIDKSNLTLYFERKECDTTSIPPLFTRKASLDSNKMKTLRIKCFDLCSKEVVNVTVIATLNKNERFKIPFKTEDNGTSFYEFKKEIDFADINITSLGYNSEKLKVRLDSETNVTLYLKKDGSFETIDKGQIVEYEINKITKKEIWMRKKDSIQKFRGFKKQPPVE